jgi:hypothetical protein
MSTIIPNTFADKTDFAELSKLDENFTYLASELDTKAEQITTNLSDLTNQVENIEAQAGLSTSVFTKQIYLQSNVAPASPSGGTYNFLTNEFVPPTGWFSTRPPSSTIPTYSSEFTFNTNSPQTTITAGIWSSPTIVAQNGTAGNNGISIYTLEIFSVNISSTPTGGVYTFTTDTFDESNLSEGWSRNMPPTGIIPTYKSVYTFSTTTPSVPQNAGTWSTPTIVALNGTDGINAINVVLSNATHSIPADSAGLNAIYTGSGTEIHVYDGASELIYDGFGISDGTWKVTAVGTNISVGSINSTSPFVTVGQQSNITSDVASISYAITGKRVDGTTFNITQVQTFSRVRTGFDATSYRILSTSTVLSRDTSGIFTPSTITISANKVTGSEPVPYAGRFKIYENEDTLAVYTSSIDELSKVYFPSSPAVNTITIELYEAGATSKLLDTETVVVVKDGTNGTDGNTGLDALNAVLSNDTQSIPTDSAGLNGIYTGTGTTIRVFEGTTELAYDGSGTVVGSWKVTASATGITVGTITDNGVFASVSDHSNMTSDKATITYTITGKRYGGDSFTLIKTQSFSKSKAGTAGNPGVDSTSYRLILSTAAIQKSISGNFNPTSLTISAISQTGSSSPVAYAARYRIYENGSSTPIYSSLSNETTKLYSPSGPSVNSIKVEFYLAGGFTTKVDEQTVVIVSDGATGSEGAGAITPIISNSNHSIPTDYLGGNGIYTGSGTTIRLFEGATELEYDGLGQANGTWTVIAVGTNIIAGTPSDGGNYVNIGDHSNMTQDKAFVTYTLAGKRLNGFAISTTVTQSLTKSKSGEAGSNATAFWLLSSAATIQKSTTGILNPATVTFSGISKTGIGAPLPYAGRFKIYENGSSTPIYTSTSDEITKVYTPSSSAITSVKIELYLGGSTDNKIDERYLPVTLDGTDSITVIASNSAHTIPTDFNGNNGIYGGSGTILRVFEGSVELTYQPTVTASGQYSVSSSASGITVGTFTDSGVYLTVGDHSNMTTDTASITYNISGLRRNGTSFTASLDQTFSKSKSGGPGADGVAYWSVTSAAAVQKSIAGIYTPSTIEISLYRAQGLLAPELYAGRFIIATTLDGSTYSNVYTSSANESQRFYIIPVNIKAIRIRSYLAGGTTTLLDEQIIPIVTDGATGETGSVGPSGSSFRICYSKTTLSALASTPATISTTGNSTFPPNGSWGTGTVWTANVSTLNAGESLYQSDGVYNPTTNTTTWNLPYLSNLKVGSLSAISSNLGSITAGSLNINNKFTVDSSGNTTVRSSTTGERLEIRNNTIIVYDANNNVRVLIGQLG